MLLEKVQKKRDFLLSFSTDEEFVRLALAVEKVTQSASLPLAGLRLPIAESLLYALFRHRNFCSSSILRDTLVSYLGECFGLSQSLSEGLIQQLLCSDGSETLKKSTCVPSTDREFIKYIFVHVACAEEESDLVDEIGLGSALLGRMKRSIEIVSAIQDAEADGPLLFLPDLDAQICEIMRQMTEDMQTTPWALQRQKLLYHIMYAQDDWGEALNVHGVGPLFEAMVAMGDRKLMTTTQITEDLAKKYPNLAQAPKITSILEDFSLAYPSGDKSKSSTRWTLSGFGMELTQDPIAQLFLERHQKTWDIRDFSALSAEYQTAVTRKTNIDDPDRIHQLIRHARPLAPKALTQLLDSLVVMNQTPIAREVALFLLRNEPSPWLRKAACRSLATTLRTETVDQAFREVARSDKSASVRAEAQACLG